MISINVTRGDNRTFKFQRKTKEGDVITDIPDEMYITFKGSNLQETFFIQKVFSKEEITFDSSKNEYRFEITPEDTNELAYGDYVFDIEITKDNKVKTIAKGTLIIKPEVTFASNKEEEGE